MPPLFRGPLPFVFLTACSWIGEKAVQEKLGEFDTDSEDELRRCPYDADGDGYGGEQTVITEDTDCHDNGEAPTDGDCNDSDSDIHPGAEEICGGLDEDCDERIDEQDTDLVFFGYVDADGDGFGSAENAISCEGRADNDDDCNDAQDAIAPGNSETDVAGLGIDSNCDGIAEHQLLNDFFHTTPDFLTPSTTYAQILPSSAWGNFGTGNSLLWIAKGDDQRRRVVTWNTSDGMSPWDPLSDTVELPDGCSPLAFGTMHSLFTTITDPPDPGWSDNERAAVLVCENGGVHSFLAADTGTVGGPVLAGALPTLVESAAVMNRLRPNVAGLAYRDQVNNRVDVVKVTADTNNNWTLNPLATLTPELQEASAYGIALFAFTRGVSDEPNVAPTTDLFVASPNAQDQQGALYIYLGAELYADTDDVQPVATLIGPPDGTAGGFGRIVAACDFDGDGDRTDVAVGDPAYNGGAGAVWIYRDTDTGTHSEPQAWLLGGDLGDQDQSAFRLGEQLLCFRGRSLQGELLDFDVLAVTAGEWPSQEGDNGRVFLYADPAQWNDEIAWLGSFGWHNAIGWTAEVQAGYGAHLFSYGISTDRDPSMLGVLQRSDGTDTVWFYGDNTLLED